MLVKLEYLRFVYFFGGQKNSKTFTFDIMNKAYKRKLEGSDGDFEPLKHHKQTSLVKKTQFNDPVHEMIEMHGLCKAIIDTPEFQRLEYLKQLGVCNYVYRNATHSRFIHSLGVAHLAEKLAIEIKKNQPYLEITESDITCVKVAGLCHDLGHGPFSHVFDGIFMKRMYPRGVPDIKNDSIKGGNSSNNEKDIQEKGNEQLFWRHEDGSSMMFNHILIANDIRLEDYDLDPAVDKLFIEEMIRGTEATRRQGRVTSKHWLYDIVNNIRSGLDVDKLDYLMRDMTMANVRFASTFGRYVIKIMSFCVLKIMK